MLNNESPEFMDPYYR